MKKLLPLIALACATQVHAAAITPEVAEKIDILGEVFERVRTAYVEDVTETELLEDAINGMLTALDPHSAYLDKKDFQDMQEQTKGEFGGLGIEVTMDNGLVKVVAPIEDTPAAEAGIEAGDLIIRIDEEDVQGMTLSEAVDKMRGKVGSDIEIKVFREKAKKTFDITITRAIIQIKPVKTRLEEAGIGYLRITSFNDHVETDMKKQLKELVKENDKKPLRGLIIDLRNNPGGLLNQAIAVSDAFLDDGEIVSTRGRLPNQNSSYEAKDGDLINGAPIVVLINGGSASASEIVAGALQDHKRAVVLGTKSFGKGSVQTIIPLRGNAGMRLTTALYYTPSGRSIQAEGIVPDVEVKHLKVEELDQPDWPSEASLRGHLENGNGHKEKGKKGNDDTDADGKKKPKDYQLQHAIDTVKALSLWQNKEKPLAKTE